MASSSSSASPRPDHALRFDVFLSFRGEDTRHTFTDHLYHALLRAGLTTFRDDNAIERGQELKPEIETAIVDSKASIVVLSENYASSRWCLNELWLILEQRRMSGHFVLPVFYHVDPSDVRNQRGSFAIEGSKWKVDDVSRWTVALTEVANLTGLVLSSSRPETDFITEMVDTIQRKLDLKQLSTPAHLTGMETRLEAINSWLRNEQSNAIAICGMGGSGKTTLAHCLYNLNKQNFESSSFIEDIGKHYKHGLLGLQGQLLRDVLGGNKIMISSVSEGTNKIEEVLQKKKVLIVLDDIDDQNELCTLLGTKAFPTQSKIIITTRLLDVDAWFRSISWKCWVHNLKFLNDHESLELLSWHAFGSKIPLEGFEKLAVKLANYCGGNPLALKVLGSSLSVNDEDPSKIKSMIEIWKDRVSSLRSSKGDLDSKIQEVLRKSFDSLPLNSHKELFLDIACFFVGESQDMVTIFRNDLHAKSGIMTLINRCLITVSHDTGELMMHQLLQDMGRTIACENSKHPAEHRRVWLDDVSYHLLRKGDGSDRIEGLTLDMLKIVHGLDSEALALKTSSLAKMRNLKLLRLKYVKLTGSYENFPELRWLSWQGCPLKTVPSGLLMSSLVALDMRYGHVKMFEVPTVLNSLKILNLEGCYKLVSIRNLHHLPKLETLILLNCYQLCHLCKSIGDLECLANINLTCCTQLWKASKKLERVKALCICGGFPEQPLLFLPKSSLVVLDISYCDLGYNNDVHVVFHAPSLFKLCLSGNWFEYLPSNIDLKLLRILNLYSCKNLKSLPCIPSTLAELYIDECKSLERITFQSGRFSLQVFEYRHCFKLSEVQGLFRLIPIAEIDEADLVQHMRWIKTYEHHKVEMVGDEITIDRLWPIQMLYEYGIMSTYLQGIEDKIIIPAYEYTSSSSVLSFHVPLCHEKSRIQGLNVSCLYRSSISHNKDTCDLWAKISNKTKGLTWIYNPVVYCKPRVNEDVVWLSYWPIENLLDAGDEVHVDIIHDEGMMMVTGCGASVVYMNDELEKEENWESNMMKVKEVIGGDLSEFEVMTGGYYLCRRDLFGLETSTRLKQLFDDNVDYPESKGWKKTRSLTRTVLNISKKIVVGLRFNGQKRRILKKVSSVAEIESLSTDVTSGRLIVIGDADPVTLIKLVRKFDIMAEILSIGPAKNW